MIALHVWRLDEPADDTALSPDEHARAGRFATAKLAARFVAGRAGMRAALGSHLRVDPRTLAFSLGPHGKPGLQPPAIEFNLSHSGDLAMLAIANAPVGVDIERLRPVREGVAQRYFSPLEQRCLAAWSSPEEGFCAVWTAKEAIMKGLGLGFALPLTAFEVETPPDAPPRLVRLDRAYDDVSAWTLERAAAPEGYVATLALRNP